MECENLHRSDALFSGADEMPSRRRRTNAATTPTRRFPIARDDADGSNGVFSIASSIRWVRGLTASAWTEKAARTGARAA